jgi:hypothetical protein
MEVIREDLSHHYAQLDALRRQAAMAKTQEGREELRRGRERLQAAEDHRLQQDRERRDQLEADQRERQQRQQELELEQQRMWAAERDRLTGEIAQARDALSAVLAGNTDEIPAEVAERLRLRIWRTAVEQLIEDAEESLHRHNASAGIRSFGRAA